MYYTSHQVEVDRNLIFCEDRKIHLSETRQLSDSTLEKGGMTKLMEDAESERIQAIYYLAMYGLKVGGPLLVMASRIR